MAKYRRLFRWLRCRRETQPRKAVSSPLPPSYSCRLNLIKIGATRSLNRSSKTLWLRTLFLTSTTGSAPSSSLRITPLLLSAPESGFPFFRYRNSDSLNLRRQTFLPVGMSFGPKTIMSKVDIVSTLLPTTILSASLNIIHLSPSPSGFRRQSNARYFPLPENHHRRRERARCRRRL